MTFPRLRTTLNDLTKWRESCVYDSVQCIMGYKQNTAWSNPLKPQSALLVFGLSPLMAIAYSTLSSRRMQQNQTFFGFGPRNIVFAWAIIGHWFSCICMNQQCRNYFGILQYRRYHIVIAICSMVKIYSWFISFGTLYSSFLYVQQRGENFLSYILKSVPLVTF